MASTPSPAAGSGSSQASSSRLAKAAGLHAETINKVNKRGMPYAPFVTNVDDFVGGQQAGVEGIMRSFEEMLAKYRYMEVNLQTKRKGLEVKLPDIKKTLEVVRFLEERRCKVLGTKPTQIPSKSDLKKAASATAPGDQSSDDDDDDLVDDVTEEDDDLDEEDIELNELNDEIEEVDAGADEDDAETGQATSGKASSKRGRPQPPLKTLYELNDTLYADAEVVENGTVGLWLGANTMLEYPLSEAVLLLAEKLRVAKRSLRHTVADLEFLREQVTIMEVNFARVHNWDVKRRQLLKQKEQSTSHVKSLKEDGDDEQD